MKLSKLLTAATGGLALALAGCGDDAEEVDDTALADTDTLAVVDFDPLSREYTLTPEQQTRRDAFDAEAMQTEYAGYRDEMSANGGQATSATSTPSADGGMPARSEMDWAYLDRNGDGQLSVAEYSIWAIPVDPNEPKRNDETKPYLTSDQANKAADSFFYYDTDGDTYLSQQEFEAARRGDTIA